jgi:hypothetical protein
MEEDINAMDKQCFLIVQHIILSMVRKSLVAINEGIIHEGLKI